MRWLQRGDVTIEQQLSGSGLIGALEVSGLFAMCSNLVRRFVSLRPSSHDDPLSSFPCRFPEMPCPGRTGGQRLFSN